MIGAGYEKGGDGRFISAVIRPTAMVAHHWGMSGVEP